MSPNHLESISQEHLLYLVSKVGEDKYITRQNVFIKWINDFVASSTARNQYPIGTRFLNGMHADEIGAYLNYFYWYLIETFVRQILKMPTGKETRINHYKIAATIEFIVMKYQPFEDKNGVAIIALNADFAFHVSLQILFTWNLNKDNIDASTIKDLLINNKPTKEFILEHKTWLNNHATANQYSILSNMQTMRLFHYWFREPKDGSFVSH